MLVLMALEQVDQTSFLVRGSLQPLLGGRMQILGSVLRVEINSLLLR